MPMDSLQDLQRKWDSASRWYDLATMALEAVVFRRLLKASAGRVLEVAAGSGLNLAHYPGGLDITAVDLSPGMLIRARNRGARKAAVMDAQHLAFRDGSFDTVVSTLCTCTFPNPVEALREMRRVCRPRPRRVYPAPRTWSTQPSRHLGMARSPGSKMGSSSRLLVESRTA